MAHPPGLLLYYKNSDQLGRPGCINLRGAFISPSPGKDRQLKIKKGSRVYYLRTLNKENRQAWLDAITKSNRTYEKSLHKAAVGGKSGASLPFQQSMPLHLVEEWKEQERELNSRLARRLLEIEPVRQEFLQQLQTLQQSLSVISGALGFTNQSDSSRLASVPISVSHLEPSAVEVGSEPPQQTLPVNVDLQTSKTCDGASWAPVMKSQGNFLASNISDPTFGQRKAREHDSQVSLISSLSEPIPSVYTENRLNVVEGQRYPYQQSAFEDGLSSPDYEVLHEHGRCIGREFFRRRRRDATGTSPLEKGHFSDTEVWSPRHPKRASPSTKDTDGKVTHQQAEPIVTGSVDTSFTKYADDSTDKEMAYGSTNGMGRSCDRNYINQGRGTSNVRKGISQPTPTLSSIAHSTQGPIHAAWSSMQYAFTEVLKGEIHRVIELEAENAVLQHSLAMLPQLQQDRRDLLDLRERMKRHNNCTNSTAEVDRDIDEEYGDDEDTDDEISVAHSDVTNEDYYEALEVLNQHDFIAKSMLREELEVLAERDEFTQEPPEESDLSIDAENLSEAEGEDYEHPRTRLPAPRPLSRGFSLWTVLKNAIGKDLNHITMPATINEPLSVLQRCAEELQFRDLLEKASQLHDSIERLVWVSVFACATYHGSPHRDAKPFNPLLGETYEWQSQDGKLRFITEQVSHHPPVLAFQGESMAGDYTIYGDMEIKNKFWGKSVEVIPAGVVHLRIPKFGDHFSWSKVTTCIHNIVVGKLWIDNYGELVIRNHTTGEVSRIRILKASSREQGCLTGKVFDNKGAPQCSIHGNYMKEISITPDTSWIGKEAYGDSKCLWKCPDAPEDYEQQYCFSQFTIGLNELTPKLRDALPPTDSRFRPDQRALEDGDLEKATPEKLRLEEKQREARKKRKELGQEWKNMWFQQVKASADDDAELAWLYNGQYWDARERKAWQSCPDIM